MSSPTLRLRTPSSTSAFRSHIPTTFPPIFRSLTAFAEADPFLPYNRRVCETRQCVLEWDNASKSLQVWYWPVVNGQRVPPSELQDLRNTHNFRGPGCLCSSTTADPTAFTEAAMFQVTTGTLAGQYVAACAQGSCKYWIMLERLYPRRGLPVKVYPVRSPNTAAPEMITYRPVNDDRGLSTTPFTTAGTDSARSRRRRAISSASPDSDQRPRKRARRAVTIDPFIIPDVDPVPRPRPTNAFSLLMLLDATRGAGLTYAEFRGLFIRCRGCNLIMTHRGYRDHVCPTIVPTSGEIIDLTGED